MGIDKEAMDIWKFGRSRPDLSLDETLATPEPKRQQLLESRTLDKFEDLKSTVLPIARRFVEE